VRDPAHSTIDLNADLGEGFPCDLPLLDRVSSASISCGEHAGDREAILLTLSDGAARGVVLGAHPGYADRERFGRREQNVSEDEVEILVVEQTEKLKRLAAEVGAAIHFIKPHGALYNQAMREPEVALGIVRAAVKHGLPVVGLPRSEVESIAREQSVRFIREGFPERRYTPEGRLVHRSQPNAVLTDPVEIEQQTLRLLRMDIETLCIHGDAEHAVAVADIVLSAIRGSGIVLRSFCNT
jgi:5-oxoprolinase (ATP-hydrolysing) subunit A